MNKANQIAEHLKEAKRAYYQTDLPLMSDDEFDALEEELRKINPHHEYFNAVGVHGEDNKASAKIRHHIPMLSMGKAKSMDEAKKWLIRLAPKSSWEIAVEPKVDGLSACLLYTESQLSHVATRGDGKMGQNISHIAEFVRDIPSSISFTKEDVEIRGELYLPKDTDYDTEGKPLRNNCVGLINRKDNRSDLKYVRFLAYQIIWPQSEHETGGATTAPQSIAQSEPRFNSEFAKIDILKESGFHTFEKWLLGVQGHFQEDDPLGVTEDIIQQFERIYTEYMETLRASWTYETDGLVLLVNDNRFHHLIDARWVVDHHHHYALAFKPPAQAVYTRLKKVLWQISRQGNLVPVAQFEPVHIGGAVLERASLHNAQTVRKLKLAIGDSILVERANDVIPHIRENIDGKTRAEDFQDDAIWPKNCPSCKVKLIESGVHIACPNDECRDRVLQNILYWIRECNMEQIALQTLKALYDSGKLRTIRDIYTLKADDFAGVEGFGEKKIANFFQQTKQNRSMSPIDFISRLGIPMLQKKSLIRLGIKSLEDFMDFEDDTYAVGRNLVEWKKNPGNLTMLHELLEEIDLLEVRNELGGEGEKKGVICLTGKAPIPRKKFISIVEEAGWIVTSSFNKDTVKVICNNPDSGSEKIIKARQKGIEILTYEYFIDSEGIPIQ